MRHNVFLVIPLLSAAYLLCRQVKYLEVVDVMVGQLLRRLAEAEAQGAYRFAMCVTGDHSTPALFGDHSHEPVPLAIAHVRHVVRAGRRVWGMDYLNFSVQAGWLLFALPFNRGEARVR